MKTSHLHPYWYLLAPSKKIKHKLRRFYLFGQPIVCFRDQQGKCHAYLDYCPHRGVPLSDGRLVNNQIECGYHGWRFSSEGHCQYIPSLNCAQPFQLKSVALQECDDHLFVSLHSQPQALPVQPIMTDFKHFYWCKSISSTLIDLVENFLDATHTPFIHRGLMASLIIFRLSLSTFLFINLFLNRYTVMQYPIIHLVFNWLQALQLQSQR